MEQDFVSNAGVDPGGLTHSFEIKILICLILSRAGAMSFAQLNEAIVQTRFVNYFEYASALAELLDAQNVCIEENKSGEAVYSVTGEALASAEALKKAVPPAIRDKAIDAAKRILIMAKREAENIVSAQKVPDGYIVSLRMKDVGSDLLDLRAFTPDPEGAKLLRERVLKDPVAFYRAVTALLFGDEEDGEDENQQKMF